jgi:hypothetical protein
MNVRTHVNDTYFNFPFQFVNNCSPQPLIMFILTRNISQLCCSFFSS